MGKRRIIPIAVVLVLCSLMIGAFVWSMKNNTVQVLAQGKSEIGIMRHILKQDEVSVVVTGSNLTNVGGFEFDLLADPSVVRLVGASAGPFLYTSNRAVGSLGPILGVQGENIAFGGYSYDPSGHNALGPSGSGALAYVTMTVNADGVSKLTLQNLIVADVNGAQLGVRVMDAALQVRTLHPGWNLFAPCVDTRGVAVSDVMQSLGTAYDLIIGQDAAFSPTLAPIYQSLTEVGPPWAYWVRVTSSTPVTFTQVAGIFNPHTPITLTTGWWSVGFCVRSSLPVTVALQSIAGRYSIVVGEEGVYVPGLLPEYQTLQTLVQGRGYLIRMSADGVLRYPSDLLALPRQRFRSKWKTLGISCAVSRTPYMTLVYGQVRVNGKPAPEGTVVEAVTPRGEVAGCFEVHTAGYFGVVQVYGADEEGGIPGFRDGERIAWRVNGQEAEATSGVTWRDDRALHEVVLEVGAGAKSVRQQRQFVPWLSR